jgi:signal peptidase I
MMNVLGSINVDFQGFSHKLNDSDYKFLQEILKLNAYNFPIYERIIRVYENNTLEVKNGKFYINGKETTGYQFKMDYYWMMGDNRHKSADSRYWGFVPEDHVVGRPVLVWLSLNKDKGWFDGKIRFNRFFKNAER